MRLSAQFKINLTANPSSVYLTVLSQPYATHQTQRGTQREWYQNPTPQGANQREKKALNSSLIFVSPTNFAPCVPILWEKNE